MERKISSSKSAIDFIADKKNQQKVINNIRKFNDPELEKAFQDLFNWRGDKDTYVDNRRGNKLVCIRTAYHLFERKGIDYIALGEFFREADKRSVSELLRLGRFLSEELWPLIIENDVRDQEALIYQIKTFSPTIAPVALRKLLKDAPTSDNAAELLEVCLKYGNLRAPAEQVLYELGTPEQIRLYERR